MKRMICCAMVLLFALVIPMTVSAEEIPNWSTVEWGEFNWGLIEKNEIWKDLTEWLKNEASIEEVFEVDRYCAHAAYVDAIGGILYDRFAEAPEEFLIVLAEQDADYQNSMIRVLSEEMSFSENEGASVAILEGIRLSRYDDPEAVELMMALIAKAETKLGVSITVPKTGDPILLAVAGLLLSAGGVLALRKKKIA